MPAIGITVLKNNVPWGPFTHAQIDAGLARGEFTLKYLAHAPGLKEWLPLGEVLHHVEQSALLPPLPMTQQDLPPLPKKHEPVEKASAPSVQPPSLPSPIKGKAASSLPPALPVIGNAEADLRPASFTLRVFALIIDCGILFAPVILLFLLKALTLEVQGAWEHIDHESRMQEWALLERNFHQLVLLIAVGLAWLYAAGMECSRWQATVGKYWMGLKVTDRRGQRLGFLHATGRHAAKYLSALPCFLGFIAALFSSRGLALHDRVADTRVVRR